MEITSNNLVLQGVIEETPALDHHVFGEGILRTRIRVKRMSGTDDVLPVLIPERNLQEGIAKGKRILLQGQIRTCNMKDDGGNHLRVNAFAQSLSDAADDKEINSIHLTGTLCREPRYRVTPFGREITDLMLVVNRGYGKNDYIPCIAWGRNARYVNTLKTGNKLEIQGRFQNRGYVKALPDGKTEERETYEVSISLLKLIEENHESDQPQTQEKNEQTEE